MSARLLLGVFLFEMIVFVGAFNNSACFRFLAAPPSPARPPPPAVPPAAALGSIVFAITRLAPSLIALFVFFLPEMRLATSGRAAFSTFLPTCLTIGATYFFKSGMAVRPTRTANAPRPAPEPNCLAGPWNVLCEA